MAREEMIQLLVVSGVQYVDSFRGTQWLQKILEHELRGYVSMSDSVLVAEIKARGLDRLGDAEDENEDLLGLDEDVELTVLMHEYEEESHDW